MRWVVVHTPLNFLPTTVGCRAKRPGEGPDGDSPAEACRAARNESISLEPARRQSGFHGGLKVGGLDCLP